MGGLHDDVVGVFRHPAAFNDVLGWEKHQDGDEELGNAEDGLGGALEGGRACHGEEVRRGGMVVVDVAGRKGKAKTGWGVEGGKKGTEEQKCC